MPDEKTSFSTLGDDRPSTKDLPLWEQTRLLGRTLGAVLRAETGDAAFARVEDIRRTAVRFRKAAGNDALQVQAELHALLDGLDEGETLTVVRAFSYFSLLANIAEDLHQNRRRRAHRLAGDGAQPGSIAHAWKALANAGVESARIADFLAHALVSPVLTAHPTEVQRKSVLECQASIAGLLQRRDVAAREGEPLELIDSELAALVLRLWQTATLRNTRLRVIDEIDNALSFYNSTFLHALPRLQQDVESALRQRGDFGADYRMPSVMKMGSWIGGDRDGNPYVTADVLSSAIRRQATVALRHYLDEVHALGSELSLSRSLVRPTAALETLAADAGDASPFRTDEPYRQALVGIYARLAATLAELTGLRPPRDSQVTRPVYADAGEFAADLEIIAASLRSHRSAALADGRLRLLQRAVSTFGFHLATLDLRQNSIVHEEVIAELLAQAGVTTQYRKLDEAARIDVLTRELAQPRLLLSPFLAYSEMTTGEIAIMRVAAQIHATFGADALANYVISKCEAISDLLEVGVLLREVGLLTYA
ncbi:MAG: phosphoenolpyruvate carboxylase, partial [Casimicrobiaceae bacterium]